MKETIVRRYRFDIQDFAVQMGIGLSWDRIIIVSNRIDPDTGEHYLEVVVEIDGDKDGA